MDMEEVNDKARGVLLELIQFNLDKAVEHFSNKEFEKVAANLERALSMTRLAIFAEEHGYYHDTVDKPLPPLEDLFLPTEKG